MAQQFVDRHHSYIRWSTRPSRRLYWLCLNGEQIVGVLGLASAWDRPNAVRVFMRRYSLSFNEVGNNIVFCLSGVETVRNAGSQFLALWRRDAARWWSSRYGGALRAVQTFILPPRTGAVYKADNWQCLGETSGQGQTTESHHNAGGRFFVAPAKRAPNLFAGSTVVFTRHATERKLIFMRLL